MKTKQTAVIDSPESLAIRIIKDNRYFALATMGSNQPWCAPLSYVWMGGLDIVFYSSRTSRHSQHLTLCSVAAGAIYNSTLPSDLVDGVQFDGNVSVVEEQHLANVHSDYFSQSFPDPLVRTKWQRPVEAFTGESDLRFYRFQVSDMFKLDISTTTEDRRIRLDLESIRLAMAAED